jgi:hypothetical protein
VTLAHPSEGKGLLVAFVRIDLPSPLAARSRYSPQAPSQTRADTAAPAGNRSCPDRWPRLAETLSFVMLGRAGRLLVAGGSAQPALVMVVQGGPVWSIYLYPCPRHVVGDNRCFEAGRVRDSAAVSPCDSKRLPGGSIGVWAQFVKICGTDFDRII